jgi:mRNA interferase MazF
MAKNLTPKRGEVYLADFDPAIGSEIKKTRPALILQNDVANYYSPTTIVAAISSKFNKQAYPTEVLIEPPCGGLKIRCVVMLNQMRTIDKRRLRKRIGVLNAAIMEKVNQALEISLDLIEI